MLGGAGLSLTLTQRLQTFWWQQEATLFDGEAVYLVVKAQTFGFNSQLCHQLIVRPQINVSAYNFHCIYHENYSSTYLIGLS